MIFLKKIALFIFSLFSTIIIYTVIDLALIDSFIPKNNRFTTDDISNSLIDSYDFNVFENTSSSPIKNSIFIEEVFKDIGFNVYSSDKKSSFMTIYAEAPSIECKNGNTYFPHIVFNLPEPLTGEPSQSSTPERKITKFRYVLCLKSEKNSLIAHAYLEYDKNANDDFKLTNKKSERWTILEKLSISYLNTNLSTALFKKITTKPSEIASGFINYINTSAELGFIKYAAIDTPSLKNEDVSTEFITKMIENSLVRSTDGDLNYKSFENRLFYRNLLLGGDWLGMIQFIIYFLTIYGFLYVSSYRYRDFKNKIGGIRSSINNTANPKVKSQHSDLIERLLSVSAIEKRQLLEQECDVLVVQESKNLWVIRYLIWFVPIIGFVGTIVGISFAVPMLGQLLTDDEVLKALSMEAMGKNLSVAFGTTLVGLIGSIILQCVYAHYEEKVVIDEVISLREHLLNQ